MNAVASAAPRRVCTGIVQSMREEKEELTYLEIHVGDGIVGRVHERRSVAGPPERELLGSDRGVGRDGVSGEDDGFGAGVRNCSR